LDYLQRDNTQLAEQIVLAESIVGDHVAHGFADLLSLERLLADVVAVILLFVESPGSLAELGAFTASDNILDRLSAVIEECHREHTESFVYLGPISRLTRHNEKRLMYAPWLKEEGRDEIDPVRAEKMAQSVAAGLSEVLQQNGHTKMLVPSSDTRLGHGEKMCLITGILEVCQVLSKSEIDAAVRTFTDLNSDLEISRYLYLLRKLKVIGMIDYSKQKWYYVNDSLIEWRYKDSVGSRDTMGWMRHFRDLYTRAQDYREPLGKHYGALQRVNELKAARK
jgi:hypothetical protein